MTATDDRRRGAAAALAAGAVAYWLPSVALVSAPARRLLGVRARLGAAGAVALTFDDGPHPEGTPRVLEALAAAGARAAFFLAGEQVERFPTLARALVDAGHQVGVHCHRHGNPMRLAPRQVRADLDRAAAAISAATGLGPVRYRPPYGILTAAALAEARRRGWETVLWTRAGRDWRARATPESIAARLVGSVRAGDVLLLHDADWYSARRSHERTAAALPLVLAELDRRGLRVEPLADLRE